MERPGKITQADTGLGTTYERWALYRLLEQVRVEHGVESLVEGPDDGMTGIAGLNSLGLGLRGVQVSLVLPDPEEAAFAAAVWKQHASQASPEILDRCGLPPEWDGYSLPFADGEFDLAWNFNVMTRLPDPQAALAEMARVSRKYVLVFVPNRQNYAFWLHRLHHRVAHELWDHGRVDLMHPAPWRQMFAQAGLEAQQVFWVDCPWWPDIVDLGQLAADFFPLLKRPPFDGLARRAKPENRSRWEAGGLPYFRPEAFPQVHQQMAGLAYFENSRREWLKKRFAHHVGVLGVKTA